MCVGVYVHENRVEVGCVCVSIVGVASELVDTSVVGVASALVDTSVVGVASGYRTLIHHLWWRPRPRQEQYDRFPRIQLWISVVTFQCHPLYPWEVVKCMYVGVVCGRMHKEV